MESFCSSKIKPALGGYRAHTGIKTANSCTARCNLGDEQNPLCTWVYGGKSHQAKILH